MMMSVERLVEWELAGETEVLGENLPQPQFVYHKFGMTWPWPEPGPPRWEPWLYRFTVLSGDGTSVYISHIMYTLAT
jgi:hypothetical protein